MNRPWLLRSLPRRLRGSLASRWYLARHETWSELYTEADLDFCPQVRMHGLLPGDLISGHIAFTGFHELALTRHICRDAQAGGLFVDVGANMGYFSLLWAGLAPSSTVMALEPSLRNLDLLEQNVRQNGFGDRITIVPKAAGDQDGTVSFDSGPTEQTGWGGITNQPDSMTYEVLQVRLDNLLPEAPVSAMKIDTEGADTLVLKGCEGLLRRNLIRRIYFEQNEPRMRALNIDPSEAFRFLSAHGYACEPIPGATSEWVAYPKTSGA